MTVSLCLMPWRMRSKNSPTEISRPRDYFRLTGHLEEWCENCPENSAEKNTEGGDPIT
jgi:hypothetical protein